MWWARKQEVVCTAEFGQNVELISDSLLLLKLSAKTCY